MKIQGLLLAGLTIAKPRKLFGITKDEFNLKSGFVVLIQTEWVEGCVSGKEQRNSLFVWITLVN